MAIRLLLATLCLALTMSASATGKVKDKTNNHHCASCQTTVVVQQRDSSDNRVAAALIGAAVTYFIVRRHRNRRAPVSSAPVPEPVVCPTIDTEKIDRLFEACVAK